MTGSVGGWRPGASRRALEARADLLAAVRRFFAARSVMEVETPLLSAAGTSDPNIRSVEVLEHPLRWLRTSPEHALKRLLAAGSGDVYELGRVFRSGEQGRWHNPEFTMLEWYRVGWTYLDLAGEVIELICECGAGAFDDYEVRHTSYCDLFVEHTGIDPLSASLSDWEELAAERGIRAGLLDADQWQDLILSEVVQPLFEPQCITVVRDFPASRAALARVRAGPPRIAERFEIYLGRIELANGYQELTDAAEQRSRFEAEFRLRSLSGDEGPAIDSRLLAAMEHGLPECAGVALGIDRLLMAMLDLNDIRAVLAFSSDSA